MSPPTMNTTGRSAQKANGGGRRQLTDNSTFERFPSYSPSGKRIAFSSWDGHDSDIYTIKPDGSGNDQVTKNPVYEDNPCWGSQ